MNGEREPGWTAAVPSRAVRPVPYWTGVRRRAVPAALIGLVVGLASASSVGWTSAAFVGGAGSLSALLLPAEQG